MANQSLTMESMKPGLVAEPLRALRRGLTRAAGFALYVAVVKTPSQRDRLITLLAEAVPAVKLQTVTLRADSTDILDEIQQQLGGPPSGPVMLTGLEAVLPSDAPNHPILNALNLRRPDWPQRVPQPVVFWVPEYLLGLLARSAPDFLDWRSDTIHFPDLQPDQFEVLKSATWGGGIDTRLSAAARRERIRELESRIAANEHSQDRVIRSTVAGWLNELGLHLKLLGQNQEALDRFQRALSIVRDLGDKRGQGAALGNLGIACCNLGELRKAVEFYEQALAIAHDIGDRLGESQALGNLANAYQQMGNTSKAIEFYEECLSLHRQLGDRRGEGCDLGNLGLVYAGVAEPRKALDFYKQQLVIVREIGDQQGEGSALQNLGNAYANLGDKRKATEFLEQALAAFRELGDRRGESGALGDRGAVFAELGDTRKALECYEQALVIARDIGDRRVEGYALGNIAVALNQLGRRTEAIAHFESALKVFEAIEEPYAAKVRAALVELRK
jgi:tetratricopeptide (TPR) repeat protein